MNTQSIRLFVLSCMFLATLFTGDVFAQKLGNYVGDESQLYAETKQLNQFIRRFNYEENKDGVRIDAKKSDYRNAKQRQATIPMLFDGQNRSMNEQLKAAFVSEVTGSNPSFLEFHKGNWFAEVNAIFELQGREERITLYMEIEQDRQGHKWAINSVYANCFAKAFAPDSDTAKIKFIHPMSHELEFMNLNKVFEQPLETEQYTSRGYRHDLLSVFLYELGRGNLKFVSVVETKYHVFQINNWYFEISRFNREGYNSGWLVSNLSKASNDQKEMLRRFIMRK